jgi:hypothetical protein
VTIPAAGAISLRWPSRHLAWSSAACACSHLIACRPDLLFTRCQPGDVQVCNGLAHPCGRDIARRLGLVEIGLGRDSPAEQVLPALQRPLGLALLRLRRGGDRLDHGDLLRPLAAEQIGELRLRLDQPGLALGDGVAGIVRLELGEQRAGRDTLAAPDGNVLDPRRVDRPDPDMFAFDIADDAGRRRRADAERSGDGEGADEVEDHETSPLQARMLARTERLMVCVMARASSGPIPSQPMRRVTAGRAMRK